MYNSLIKRVFDLTVSCFLLIIIFPVLIFFVVILFYQNKGEVFFFQSRPGKNGASFNLIKFKTMEDQIVDPINKVSDKDRITGIGRIFRNYSLDELPQLINVIRGDMSLVGPRPLLFKYLTLYNPEQRRRHDVRPGITGWAQVNGRNNISWTKKFELDVYYVDNISFFFDFKILWLTLLKVLRKDGVSLPSSPFNGIN
jgi:undecaprenyl phosphate N,N'-diacetylbacillosamine 1-phosphate transferase